MTIWERLVSKHVILNLKHVILNLKHVILNLFQDLKFQTQHFVQQPVFMLPKTPNKTALPQPDNADWTYAGTEKITITNEDGTTQTIVINIGANDGVINSNDAVFSKLKIWQDRNQNGISEANELKTLTELGIKEIKVSPDSITLQNYTQNGNLIISKGQFTQEVTNPDGTRSEVTKSYANLDLAVNQTNSSSYSYTDPEGNIIGDYNLNLEVLTLPMIRGYGDVKALPVVASQNPELLNALKELSALPFTTYHLSSISQKIEEIIYLWTNTKEITGMRGSFDARKLAVLEVIRGEEYKNSDGGSNVPFALSAPVNEAWRSFTDGIKIKLLIQSTFKNIFSGTVTTETDESNQFDTSIFESMANGNCHSKNQLNSLRNFN